jgi:Ser/Thr protein kinase RdoA (MazF antagonist)
MIDDLVPCQNNLGMVIKHGDMNDQNVLVHDNEPSG